MSTTTSQPENLPKPQEPECTTPRNRDQPTEATTKANGVAVGVAVGVAIGMTVVVGLLVLSGGAAAPAVVAAAPATMVAAPVAAAPVALVAAAPAATVASPVAATATAVTKTVMLKKGAKQIIAKGFMGAEIAIFQGNVFAAAGFFLFF
jgi:hypothetical protein